MNDRELLELAAKAAGYQVRWREFWQCFTHAEPHNIDTPPTMAGQRHVWSPLTDDGDAMRLGVRVNAFWHRDFIHQLAAARFAHQDKDDTAAYRTAIVCIAAKIGKAMP